MKKLLTIVLLSVTILSATACSSSSIVTDATNTGKEQTTFERHTLGNGYSILADKETGVCYLEYQAGYLYGITVLLNSDGTPKTWDGEG